MRTVQHQIPLRCPHAEPNVVHVHRTRLSEAVGRKSALHYFPYRRRALPHESATPMRHRKLPDRSGRHQTGPAVRKVHLTCAYTLPLPCCGRELCSRDFTQISLITQRSQVQILPPLLVKMQVSGGFSIHRRVGVGRVVCPATPGRHRRGAVDWTDLGGDGRPTTFAWPLTQRSAARLVSQSARSSGLHAPAVRRGGLPCRVQA